MRKLIFTFALMLSVLSMQATDITLISNAFKSGNASALSGNMDTEVDVAVPGTAKKGNASEAIAALSQFFQANKPSGFEVVHHADKNEAGFFVGKIQTATKEFRANIAYVVKDGKVLIQSIRIE